MQKLLTWLLFAVFFIQNTALAASDDIARLYNFTAGTTIQSSQVNAEFNQLVNTMNTKFGRAVNNTTSGNSTFSGTNTFTGTTTFSNGTSGLLTDTVKEYTLNAGVTVGGTLLKLGYVRPTLSSDPATVEGNLWYNSTGHLLKFYDGTNTQTVATAALTPIIQSYLAGLTLSNDVGTPNTVVDVAAGLAADSTNIDYIKLSAITKSLASGWAVGTGNGCMDTGTIPTSATVHIWTIKRTDTAVTDVLCSVSATSPTMPASYTEKRRAGSIMTDGLAHIVAFKQYGDKFFYSTPPALDVDVTNQSTTAITRTLTVPIGVQVEAIINAFVSQGSGNPAVYFGNLDLADIAPSITASPLAQIIGETGSGGTRSGTGQLQIMTSTSGTISTRANAASTTLKIVTVGWIDTRGRNN